MCETKELSSINFEEIKVIFKEVFTKEPWFDDWSDDNQLNEYLLDIMGMRNPLIYGFYVNKKLIGVSIGYIKHWCRGTEYFIDEFFIKTEEQKKGYGTKFIKQIEDLLIQKNIHVIYLQTENNVPAYNFYKKLGFKDISSTVALYKDF